MTEYDQYEIEALISYSSSYTDRMMFGEMFVSRETLNLGYVPRGVAGGSFNARRLVSSRLTRNPTSYMNTAWMPGWLVNGIVTGSFLGRTQRFRRHFSEEEHFYDSFIPNLAKIHRDSGAVFAGIDTSEIPSTFTSGNFYKLYSNVDTSIKSGIVGMALGYLTYPSVASSVLPTITASYIDTKWGPAFPMESRYKTIERLFFFDGTLPSFESVSVLYRSGQPIVPASSSNSIFSIAAILSGSDGQGRVSGIYGALKFPGTGTVAGATNTWPQPQVLSHVLTAAPRDLLNHYFGFGDGIKTYKGVPGAQCLFSDESFSPDYVHSVSPRGYRYGLKAVEPEQSSCVFRIGRFGQVRDMLEQRPFSKMRDVLNGAVGIDGPVRFSFLTGSTIYSQSLDYVTATNPSYNPRDSGAWDVEYKSGQPFADMDPVD